MDDTSLDDFLDAGEESSDDEEPTDSDAEATGAADAGAPNESNDEATAESDAEATSVADAGAPSETDDGAAADREGAGPESDDDTPDRAASTVDDVAPATSTMTFSPDGATCEGCGERVTRRWTDDGALVCRACKEW